MTEFKAPLLPDKVADIVTDEKEADEKEVKYQLHNTLEALSSEMEELIREKEVVSRLRLLKKNLDRKGPPTMCARPCAPTVCMLDDDDGMIVNVHNEEEKTCHQTFSIKVKCLTINTTIQEVLVNN